MRTKYFYLDLGFFEGCNLKCDYCRNKILSTHSDFTMFDLVEEVSLFHKHFDAAVVKVSGYGEITLWKDIETAIPFLSDSFPSVQIITNGTYSNRFLDCVSSKHNITLNFTIDGHKAHMNSYRTGGNMRIHHKILDNLERAISRNIKVEINSVLHDRNIQEYKDFLEYLQLNYNSSSNCIMVFPFPVKIFDRVKNNKNHILPPSKQFASQLNLMWEKFSNILPARQYGLDLCNFLIYGRIDQCYIPWANLGSGSHDERLVCPNYGETESYGDFRKSFSNIESCQNKENSYLRRCVGSGCAKCFNHYHIINLFLTGQISLEELKRIPSLNNEQSISIATDIKQEFDALL